MKKEETYITVRLSNGELARLPLKDFKKNKELAEEGLKASKKRENTSSNSTKEILKVQAEWRSRISKEKRRSKSII